MEPQQSMTNPPVSQPSPPPAPSPSAKPGNKKTVITLWVLAALIVIGGAILAYLLWGNRDNINAEQPVNTITIKQDGFSPTTLKIKQGQEVAWVNESEHPREIYADQEAAPSLDSTGPLLKGDTYIYKFEKSGTVNFYDPQDPTKFKGTIIIE